MLALKPGANSCDNIRFEVWQQARELVRLSAQAVEQVVPGEPGGNQGGQVEGDPTVMELARQSLELVQTPLNAPLKGPVVVHDPNPVVPPRILRPRQRDLSAKLP